MEQPLDNLRQERLAKLQKIKDLGINPYPATTPNHIEVNEARNQKEGEVAIKGRLMGYRGHGKLVFTDLRDESGQIQLCFKADNLDNHQFELVRLLDVGDFIWATGSLFVTAAGELTVQVKDLLLLTKSLRPLPSEHFGLKDEEERFRQRYVDLIINPEVKGLFTKKFKFWEAIRSFMLQRQFVEVETPVLETTAGGADADPFVTHHNALDIDVYLRISMGELWQKRLMVGGFEKTFEIGRQFRNEGMSREHLQDYTQMEFYWAYADYQQGMKVVEKLYKIVAQEAFGTLVFDINGHQVDLGKTWPKLDYGETIKEKLGIDIFKTTVPDLRKKLTELKLDFDEEDTKGRLIDMLWKQVRRSIPGPAFLVGHPVEVSPLAKRDPKNLAKVERYQVILGGSEMGNGYSELNDPVDQAERFSEQQKMRDSGDPEAQMYDYDFVRALEYGMPPVTGFGVSDRLFWFLAGKSARECVLFPLMRPENFKKIATVVA